MTLPLPALGTSEQTPSLPPRSADPKAATFCRHVPEQSDDFAWENDWVTFRVYGPALAKGPENSGIDCWNKRVKYPIADKWYRLDKEQKISYHADHDLHRSSTPMEPGVPACWIMAAVQLAEMAPLNLPAPPVLKAAKP